MTPILAGQRAAFTKALVAYSRTEDENQKRIAGLKMADIINRCKAKGFTQDQITQGADIPSMLTLIQNAEIPGSVQEPLLEDPARLVCELQQAVDMSDQVTLDRGNQCVYAYGYRCAPDRLKEGRTDGDVITRIAGQISTGTPGQPALFLIIRTADCRGLEMAMQGALRVRGRKIAGGGDEWFLTTHDELTEIYEAIIGFGNGERVAPQGIEKLQNTRQALMVGVQT
jgi:hypothetical protein